MTHDPFETNFFFQSSRPIVPSNFEPDTCCAVFRKRTPFNQVHSKIRLLQCKYTVESIL